MINVTAISALRDNYIWAITGLEQGVIVVDPSESAPVLAFLQDQPLAAILVTHHHWDHTGGIAQLREAFPKVKVYGSKDAPVDQVLDAGMFELLGLKVEVLAIPGHTLDHLALHFVEQKWLFSGDTLFSAGCGKVFEGTYAQMFDSLKALIDLPADTKLFCGHEYTLANLDFALQVVPEDESILVKQRAVQALRQQGLPSLPSDLGSELKINVFLRLMHDQKVQSAIGEYAGQQIKSQPEMFAYLRQWKDERG